MEFLDSMEIETNRTQTLNGAGAFKSTLSVCLDLFGTVGALRGTPEEELNRKFLLAYIEDPLLTLKIMFFARDIREGLGERRVFRCFLRWLAASDPSTLIKNLSLVPEFGRWDDLLSLYGTQVWENVCGLLWEQFNKDCDSLLANGDGNVSLLGKWLPSVNTSSRHTRELARSLLESWGFPEKSYRQSLTRLRKQIKIIENNLREKDYTFDYSHVPSRALFKYRKAFIRNDEARYVDFLREVREGRKKMNVSALYPYDVIEAMMDKYYSFSLKGPGAEELEALDVAWNSLPDYTNNEDALVMMDGSGSMYGGTGVRPISVAMGLAIYYAERNKGKFKGSFMTFSDSPNIVRIKGKTIYDKMRFLEMYNEVGSTNIEAGFRLILDVAEKYGYTNEDIPKRLYVISDMEFNAAVEDSEDSLFEGIRKDFEEAGYKLPEVVFWRVSNLKDEQPITMHESGVALVSGMSPILFQYVTGGNLNPMRIMLSTLNTERYSKIVI